MFSAISSRVHRSPTRTLKFSETEIDYGTSRVPHAPTKPSTRVAIERTYSVKNVPIAIPAILVALEVVKSFPLGSRTKAFTDSLLLVASHEHAERGRIKG